MLFLGFGGGLEGGEDVGIVADLVQETADEAAVFGPFLKDFCLRGDGAERGVFDDLFHDFGGWGPGILLRQVDRGDLEAIEEEAGAAWVDAVVRDAEEDLADGVLDRAAVFRTWEGELGAASLALLSLGLEDGFTALVVIEAK